MAVLWNKGLVTPQSYAFRCSSQNMMLGWRVVIPKYDSDSLSPRDMIVQCHEIPSTGKLVPLDATEAWMLEMLWILEAGILLRLWDL